MKKNNSKTTGQNILLQTIMDSMMEGIITINTKGIIQSFNNGATKMFGYSANEIIGKNVNILMPEPSKSSHDGYVEHHSKTGETRIIGKERELKGLHKNGKEFPITLCVKNIEIDGQILFIGLTRDISEQKNREDALNSANEQAQLARVEAERANSLKSNFLSNISHELRTPIHSITGFSRQGMERINKWTLEEHHENLRCIKKSGDRLLLLLNDLLDLSKLESGNVKYDIKQHDIIAIVNSTIREVQPLIKEKNLRIELISEENLPIIECDLPKISQVIINLLSNAIKFTAIDKNIKIHIGLDKENQDFILLTVGDEGIPPDKR